MKAHVIIEGVNDTCIFLRDANDGSMSITNDAEAVVEWVNNLYPNKRIVYQDTEGQIDELLHDNGVFKGFQIYK